jgi:hypothetical protein
MSTFSLGLDAFIAKTKANADTVVRQASLSVLSSVVKRSPVDTGRFRGNWQTTVANPATGTLERDDKGVKGSPPGPEVYSSALNALAGTKAGETVWIVNNLPYAQRLENGYSQQAPAGMVRVTVTEFQRYVAQAASQVDK